jgi:acetolactate synthase I/III small subunit
MSQSQHDHHTLSVQVENRPGVLTRVAGLFARRGFNIESLAVGPTHDPSQSRITIRVDCEQHSVDQVIKQLYKLIDVLKVQELGATAVELELLMVKVTSSPERRPEIIGLAEVFEARVVDVGPEAVSFACVSSPDRLQALEELLEPYGIRELVRTGRIALDRDGTLGKRTRMRVVA